MSDRVDTEALAAEIVARLESKSDHEYQWPRWAAGDEAAAAVLESSWLAARDARVRADALAPVIALAEEWERQAEDPDDPAYKIGLFSAAAEVRAVLPAASSVGSGVGEGTS